VGTSPDHFASFYDPPVLEGTLERLTLASGRHSNGEHRRDSKAVLIEAVLSLGGGQRNDPDDWSAGLYS
jgi:hypothetical protein